METHSELSVDRTHEQKRLALIIEEVLDDEGWELDIEFTPEGFLELPELLNEFLETQEVSPEARVQLEVLGRLVKRAAGAAGRVAGEWQKARARVKGAKAAIKKSFEAGKRRAFSKEPAKKEPAKSAPPEKPKAPAVKPKGPAPKRKLKPSTKKTLGRTKPGAKKPAVKKPAKKPAAPAKKRTLKPTTKRKLQPGEKMVFGKVRKLRNPGAQVRR